jgi:hypothetical protein
VPELVLGAGGKAPGFVQQMLFSSPVQEKNAKGMKEKKIDMNVQVLLTGAVEHINQSISALLGGNSSTNSNASTVPSNPSLPPFKFH